MSTTEQTPAQSPTQSPIQSPPPPEPAPAPPPHHHASKQILKWIVAGLVLIVLLVVGIPWLITLLTTVSTDDAYVNGHVTFVAPRVPGQVVSVLVDDNNRVRKGDILVQLDPEPYQVQVHIAQAAVDSAKSDLVLAQAQVRSTEGHMRSLRFNLEHAIEDVDNQIALLHSKVADLNSAQATYNKAEAEYQRVLPLVGTGAESQQDLDNYKEAYLVSQAQVQAALQDVYQVRVSLGMPPKPETGDDLTQVPADLDQTFSTVKQAQYNLAEAASTVGVFDSLSISPKQMIADFFKRDPQGNLENIYAQILRDAPQIKKAQAALIEAQRNLDQALLNLRYCTVYAEIDGVITRRQVNPGNNVIAGQSLMAIRSLTEIWVDANFKETQLDDLRIGQPVDLDVDMYGGTQRFKGRISGFEFGTGSTLALLPPENATGNFVKVVQRLPVRIDLIDYDPDKLPLFVGLSVTPYVRIKEAPSGPDAGKFLQPYFFPQESTAVPETQP
jgi:membrane fusion protein, multidrug efflux system